jgi:hypothetical protein
MKAGGTSGGYEEFSLGGIAVRWKSTDVLEEHVASIFRVV